VQNVARYQSLAHGAEVLESQLKKQLAEYLNAEVVLLTVTDVASASAWLRDSFLYVRVSPPPPPEAREFLTSSAIQKRLL